MLSASILHRTLWSIFSLKFFPFLVPWPHSETLIFHLDYYDSLPHCLPVPEPSLSTDPAYWHHKNNPPLVTILLEKSTNGFTESFNEISVYFLILLFPPVPSTYFASVIREQHNSQNLPCIHTTLPLPKWYFFLNPKHLPKHFFQKLSPTSSTLWNHLSYASITSYAVLIDIYEPVSSDLELS